MARVLIVDDDEDIRRSVRSVLEQVADPSSYKVMEASNGQEALDCLRAGPKPTVVLFDLVMPLMGGEQFIQQALADPKLAARCAFICFPATPGRVTPALAAMFAARDIPVLPKPFNIDELLALVTQAAARLPSHGD